MAVNLPIDLRQLGVLTTVVVIVALSALVYLAMSHERKKRDWPEGWTLAALGWFVAVLTPIWLGLFGYVLWAMIRLAATFPDVTAGDDIRWHVLALVGLITAIGGLVGAPLALIRVFTTERQTKAAEEGLITDRITKAVDGLGSEKTVIAPALDPEGNPGRDKNGNMATNERTVPNLEVRIGAIYALERISQDSPRDHVQIMEILCAYVRENAPASGARACCVQSVSYPAALKKL